MRISEWWPDDRRHLTHSSSKLFLLESGRFYERADDGTELDLGRVRVWEAPYRIVLDFYIGTDAAHPTEVDIHFTTADGGTLVSISHQPNQNSAPLWSKRAPKFAASWDAVLNALIAARP